MLAPKKEPDSCVWVVVNAPELSVTMGSFQDTDVPVLPKGTLTTMFSGQILTVGASVSPAKALEFHEFQVRFLSSWMGWKA